MGDGKGLPTPAAALVAALEGLNVSDAGTILTGAAFGSLPASNGGGYWWQLRMERVIGNAPDWYADPSPSEAQSYEDQMRLIISEWCGEFAADAHVVRS